MESLEWRDCWEREGYALVQDVFPEGTVAELRDQLADAFTPTAQAGSRRGGSVYAVRNALEIPAVRSVVEDGPLRALAHSLLRPKTFAVRAILFDKTPDANWPVPWHQDLSIAVQERRENVGWGPWSEKAGVPHVQPPTPILEQMATTRLHLDPCGPENGPLQVLPGTHRSGRLSAAEIEVEVRRHPAIVCTAGAGDILLMRPLLLHASGKAVAPGHRRVLHVEWATENLPGGLAWFERV